MSKGFYTKLAADNIRKNSRTYLPYIITCIITVAMFYMICSLSLNEGLANLKKGTTVMPSILKMGSIVTGIFAVIFLFYTASFLMKRRKKEFGLFNILGMEKKHIARVVALETMYTALISLTFGLFVGIGLDKLMFLAIIKMIGAGVVLGFYISSEAMLNSIILFGTVFLVIMLNSVRQIYFSNPAELLLGGNKGEREPKTKWLMALLGVGCLGVGYTVSILTEDIRKITEMFFLAVVLVIAGTYMLFAAGSVFVLKALKRNKKYYYKTRHFISVSGMIYRMKQNSVGLANICILSTMVLVMLSSVTAMMIGIAEVLNYQYPTDVVINLSGAYLNEDVGEDVEKIRNVLDKYSDLVDVKGDYPMLCAGCAVEGERIVLDGGYSVNLNVITADAYRQRYGEKISLKDGEAAILTDGTEFKEKELDLFGAKYSIDENIHKDSRIPHAYGLVDITVILNDYMELESAGRRYQEFFGNDDGNCYLDHRINFNFKDIGKENEILNEIKSSVEYHLDISTVEEEKGDFMDVYGSFFFLGIFLGVLFIMAAVLIMYYKQISEGYDDKVRFEIMQKVGLSKNEVKSAIHSQVLVVFFLPLVTAGLHLSFAFPIISRMITAARILNTRLYIFCAIGSFLLFAVLYAVFYLLTARAYYRIVSTKN